MLDLGEWERRRGLLRDVRAAADLRHAQRGRHPASTAPDAAQMRRDLGRAEKKISSLKAENACLEAELYKRDAQSQCGQLLYMQQQQLLTQQRQQAAADKGKEVDLGAVSGDVAGPSPAQTVQFELLMEWCSDGAAAFTGTAMLGPILRSKLKVVDLCILMLP
ncbi:unnamed protein product, partial [Symbiodinium sp. KB8]